MRPENSLASFFIDGVAGFSLGDLGGLRLLLDQVELLVAGLLHGDLALNHGLVLGVLDGLHLVLAEVAVLVEVGAAELGIGYIVTLATSDSGSNGKKEEAEKAPLKIIS